MKIMLSILVPLLSLLLLLLVPHAATTWSAPVKIVESSKYNAITILSLYRDPVSSMNHIFVTVGARASNFHYHMALKDDGTVLYKTSFVMTSHDVASLRGSGDGKGLFLVYSSGAADLMFSESSDGGENWSDVKNIVEDVDSEYRLLGDMLRVDSGRLFVAFMHKVRDNEIYIKMVNRPTGSSVFSKESVIASDSGNNYQGPAAAYGYRGGKLRLHVTYVRPDDDVPTIVYTYSDDNGVSWSKGRNLDGTTGTSRINYLKSVGDHLYLSYTISSSQLQLVHSADFGATFGPPQMFYARKPLTLATCNTKNYKKLASLRPAVDSKIEYATWDPATLKSRDAKNITLPEVYCVTDTAIDCVVDVKKNLRKIVAFITTSCNANKLYISVDTAAAE